MEMSVLKIPKCALLLILIDSSPTPALSSLTSLIYTIITMCLSMYVSILCSFSDVYHFSLFDSYILVSWLFRKSCLHTGSSFYIILKKELFSSHAVNYRRGSGLVFQLKTVFKDLKIKTYISCSFPYLFQILQSFYGSKLARTCCGHTASQSPL